MVADGQAGRVAVTFARVLRGAGLDVPVSSVVAFSEALAAVGLAERTPVYWAGMATLVRGPEDRRPYDCAFRCFFDGVDDEASDAPLDEPESMTLLLDTDDDSDDDAGGERSEDDNIELRFSTAEVLARKDFADYDDDELRESHELMRRFRFAGAPRRSRRLTRSSSADRPDVARTVRAAFATAGEPVRRHYRSPAQRTRRLVLLLDVSGSMDPYARAMLRFVHAAVSGRQRVEAFALGTRLTRLTRELASRDPGHALSGVSDRVTDWSGGTRLGDMLGEFNDKWGQRGLAHGAHVVILSDGWDRGDPVVLGNQMARLQRVAYQVVWVNPLKVSPGYAPLARGMAAALPYVDEFVEGHSVEAMERLVAVVSNATHRRKVRYA